MRRLRSAFEPNTFVAEITERVLGVLAAHGPLPLDELAERVYEVIGCCPSYRYREPSY